MPGRAEKEAKIKKHHFRFISSQNGWGRARKEVKKNFVPTSLSTRPIQKYSQKNSTKIRKYHSCFFSSQSGLGQTKKKDKKNFSQNSPHDTG